MKLETLVAQITANAPECPVYQINGFLLEFLHMVRLQGRRELLEIDTSDWASGRTSVTIPANVLTVHNVYLNGVDIPTTLKEGDVVLMDDNGPGALLDADGAALMDYDAKYLETE